MLFGLDLLGKYVFKGLIDSVVVFEPYQIVVQFYFEMDDVVHKYVEFKGLHWNHSHKTGSVVDLFQSSLCIFVVKVEIAVQNSIFHLHDWVFAKINKRFYFTVYFLRSDHVCC